MPGFLNLGVSLWAPRAARCRPQPAAGQGCVQMQWSTAPAPSQPSEIALSVSTVKKKEEEDDDMKELENWAGSM